MAAKARKLKYDTRMSDDDPFGAQALPRRANKMRRVLEWLESTGATELSTYDLNQLHPDLEENGKARVLAARLVRRGILQRLAPGRYAVVRSGQVLRSEELGQGEQLDHWLSRGYAVAFRSAMALHGYGTLQDAWQRLQVMVSDQQPRLPRNLTVPLDVRLRAGSFEGAVRLRHPTVGEVNVRSLPQTLIDAAAHPTRCGGIEAVTGFVAFAVPRCSIPDVVALGVEDGGTSMRRLGYLLQRGGAPANVVAPLQRVGARKHLALDPDAAYEGPLDATWRLKLNAPLDAVPSR